MASRAALEKGSRRADRPAVKHDAARLAAARQQTGLADQLHALSYALKHPEQGR